MSKKNYLSQHKKSVKNNASNENKYNLIINQTNTYNQDNSINILLDGTFSYLNTYSYQPKIKEYKQINTEPKDIEKHNSKYIKIEDKILEDEASQKSTNKIDYRYMKKYPINKIIEEQAKKNLDKNKESKLFWFAAYGKLMKTKNLMKILNFYNYGRKKVLYDNISIKEKSIKIDDYETFFQKGSNKLYIKYSQGNYIYAKLYLLTLKEISLIFKYMNRTECEIEYDKLNYFQKKGSYHRMDDKKNKFIFPYGLIYYLGDYMNTKIFTFSNMIAIDNDYSLDDIKYELPKSKKIVKLIKIINRSFPDLSVDEIINYLIPEKKYINSFSKISEIKNILFFNKKFNQSRIILSSMVKDTIKGIPIPTTQSILSSFCPETIDNQIRNIDLFKNISFPISSFKDEYNMQIINSTEIENENKNTFINDMNVNKELTIKKDLKYLDKSRNVKNIKSSKHSRKNLKKQITSVKKEKKNFRENKKDNKFSKSEKTLYKNNFNSTKKKKRIRISKDNFILNNSNICNSFKYSGSKQQNYILNNSSEINNNC